MIATAGIFALWRFWVYGLAFLLMGFLFAAFWRRARILTDAELVQIRYSGNWRLPLRLTKAVYFGLVINSITLGFVLLAAFQISELFLPWHTWLPDAPYRTILNATRWMGLDFSTVAAQYGAELATANNVISVALLLLFVGLYSTTGGLRGVITTDIFQFSLAMGASIVFAIILLGEVGGLSNLTERIVSLYGDGQARRMLSFTPTIEGTVMPFLIIMGLQWIFHMNSDGTGYLAQRFMACSADRETRIAARIFSWVQILGRSLVWLVIGVVMLALYPFSPAETLEPAFTASRERTFLLGISDFMPNGARGLMITAMLAALASTIDTHLNWGSSYLTNDVYKRLICQIWRKREPKSRELVLVARVTSVLVLLAGCLVAGPILLWAFPEEDMEWIRLGTMVLVSTAGTVLIALLPRPTDERILLEFHRIVRPFGFWGRTAARAGDSPAAVRRALGCSLLAALSCGGSLFLTLVGISKILLRLPGDTYLLPLLFMLGAALLVPLWWGRLTKRE